MSKIDGFVFYSDGAAKTKYGSYASYGLHGYAISFAAPKAGTGDNRIIPTILGYNQEKINTTIKPVLAKDEDLYKNFADQIPEYIKSIKNTKQLEFDKNAKITPLAYIDAYGSISEEQTNNRGELTGFLRALQFIGNNEHCREVYSLVGETVDEKNEKPLALVILSDSKYVVEGVLEYRVNWKANGWAKKDGIPIKNIDLWESIDREIERLKTINVFIMVGWVEGHNGNIGNDRADMLANIAYNAISDGNLNFHKTIINQPRGYWNPTNEYNRLINLPYYYYNTYNKNYNHQDLHEVIEKYEYDNTEYNVYSFGYHGKSNKEFGKPLAEGSLSILLLKEKVKELEIIKDFQCSKNTGKYIDIAIGKTGQLLSSKISFLLNMFKGDCLTKGYTTEIIREEGTKENELSEILFPPLLARIGINEITYLFNKLRTYLIEKNLNLPAPLLTVTEVTDQFFQLDESGKNPLTN